jgi:hypothetical protein
MTSTHTVVTMDVRAAAYDEIAAKLKAAGYDHVFWPDADGDLTKIDMTGIALVRQEPKEDNG